MWRVFFPALLLCLCASAEDAASYRKRALELSRQKSWDQAIENYGQAIRLEPNDADTHYNLALTLKYKGDARAAANEFQEVIRLKPDWGEARFGLGAALYDLHDARRVHRRQLREK